MSKDAWVYVDQRFSIEEALPSYVENKSRNARAYLKNPDQRIGYPYFIVLEVDGRKFGFGMDEDRGIQMALDGHEGRYEFVIDKIGTSVPGFRGKSLARATLFKSKQEQELVLELLKEAIPNFPLKAKGKFSSVVGYRLSRECQVKLEQGDFIDS